MKKEIHFIENVLRRKELNYFVAECFCLWYTQLWHDYDLCQCDVHVLGELENVCVSYCWWGTFIHITAGFTECKYCMLEFMHEPYLNLNSFHWIFPPNEDKSNIYIYNSQFKLKERKKKKHWWNLIWSVLKLTEV